MKTRREFIKSTCLSCLGLGVTFSALTSCSGLPIYRTLLSEDLVYVPLSELLDQQLLIVRDLQVPYDVLIVKKTETEYIALYMKCTHQENAVSATSSGLFCSAHGSRFDLDGNVLKEPALAPLKKFDAVIIDDKLQINLKS